jgi:hypothetical protein
MKQRTIERIVVASFAVWVIAVPAGIVLCVVLFAALMWWQGGF